MRLSVIGTGYLGAVHAAGMAVLGHDVIGVDSDQAKIATLQRGDSPFFEPGLPELLREAMASGRLRFTTSIAEAARGADVHFVCVGTPQLADSDAADVSQVVRVVDDIAVHLGSDDLIVGKSTVPVGTADRLRARLFAASDRSPALAWNPEFLREGFAVEDTLRPDRLVFGVADDRSELVLRELYDVLLATGTPCIVTDLASAELVKVAANSFLATKISFINAVAEVCEATGADVVTIADAIGLDDRIGRRFLNAGVGFGGGCLGKDIRAFKARADELGITAVGQLLNNVDNVNNGRRRHVVERAAELLDGDVAGRRIAVLGAAFKPNSDDVRDSPALDVARRLAAAGADVRVHDPEAGPNAWRAAPELRVVDDVDNAFDCAELIVHLTEWATYSELDPALMATLVDAPVLLDGRNTIDASCWSAAGWECHALGRPSHPSIPHLALASTGSPTESIHS